MKKEYIQFSKRLAFCIAVFWCVFRVLALVLLLVNASIASGLLSMTDGVDAVMMFSIGCYTGNSVSDKGLSKYFESKKTVTTDTDEEVG